ncbi:permease-like cell division protein FtsX [Actinophytocola sp.]|uniref:permease-like cell division protein FtsX n=1 Tax=Actinophytocola sp. TaxID=1872138 RepID=UPI003D6A03A3
MDGSRKVALWWAAAVTVLVLVGAAVVVFVLTGSPQPAAAGPDACSSGPGPQQVVVYFDEDAEMRTAAKKLRDDDRIVGLDTETKRETWERFKAIFADQPELVKLARPEAMPASLWLLPAEGTTPADLADQMRDELPKADSVKGVPCPMPTTAPRTPTTEPS